MDWYGRKLKIVLSAASLNLNRFPFGPNSSIRALGIRIEAADL